MNVYNGVSLVPAAGPGPRPGRRFTCWPWAAWSPKGLSGAPDGLPPIARPGVEVRLTLAGDGPERGKIRELIDREGLAQRVSLPGAVPHREVARLMAGADLLVMPSLIVPSGDRDGIPNVILEALLCEVPVGAGNANGLPRAPRGPGRAATRPGDPEAPGQGRLRGGSHARNTPDQKWRRRADTGREFVEAGV